MELSMLKGSSLRSSKVVLIVNQQLRPRLFNLEEIYNVRERQLLARQIRAE